ncbi:hypothetical protein DL95DRAFT_367845, partial [Leptodontidium sp. 2 PMI_412]
PHSKIGTETIQIGVGVGDKRQTFNVHKALLQKHTKFFDTSLASETGKNGFIFLNDEDPDVFRIINDWLYTVSLSANHSVRTYPYICIASLFLRKQQGQLTRSRASFPSPQQSSPSEAHHLQLR